MSPRSTARLQLVRPSLTYLPGYVAALRSGWSPDNVRGETAAREELAKIDQGPQVFVEQLFDPEAKVARVTLPGSTVTRLPGFRLWLSQKAISANGGVLVERFTKPPQYERAEGLRFRINL